MGATRQNQCKYVQCINESTNMEKLGVAIYIIIHYVCMYVCMYVLLVSQCSLIVCEGYYNHFVSHSV